MGGSSLTRIFAGDLLCAREKDGVFLSQSRYGEMTTEIEELTAKAEAYTTEMAKITSLFEKTSEKLVATSVELTEVTQTLETTQVALVGTTQDRDEQAHLVAAREATEVALTREASTLIETAHTTVEHIRFALCTSLYRAEPPFRGWRCVWLSTWLALRLVEYLVGAASG